MTLYLLCMALGAALWVGLAEFLAWWITRPRGDER